jgi:hypothetical protein
MRYSLLAVHVVDVSVDWARIGHLRLNQDAYGSVFMVLSKALIRLLLFYTHLNGLPQHGKQLA